MLFKHQLSKEVDHNRTVYDFLVLFNDDATPDVVDSPQTSIGDSNTDAYLLYFVRRQPVAVAMI